MKLGLNLKTGLIVMIVLVVISMGALFWVGQSNSSQQQGKIPAFELNDVEGGTFNLSGRAPKPAIIHFMAVACGGGFSSLNDVRLRELADVKDALGGDVEIITVLVTTCTTTDLAELKRYYNVTWTFGNDYDDSKLDILESFKTYDLTDGSLIICTPQNKFDVLIRDEVGAKTLIGKLDVLLG